MEEKTESLLSELGGTVIFQGHLGKLGNRAKLESSNFDKRYVQIICIPNDGFTKLFYLAKRKSPEFFGAAEKDKLVFCLAYWKTNEIIPLRLICLDACDVYETIDEVGTPVKNCFTLVTQSRKFHFQASSESEKQAWIDILCDVLEANTMKVGNNQYEFVKTKLSVDEITREESQANCTEDMYAKVKLPQENHCLFWSTKRKGDRDSGISCRSSSDGSDQQPPKYNNVGWSKSYDQVNRYLAANKPYEGPSYQAPDPTTEPFYDSAENILAGQGLELNLTTDTTEPVYEIPDSEKKDPDQENATCPVQEEGSVSRKTFVDWSSSILTESKVDKDDQDVFEDNGIDCEAKDPINRTVSAPVSHRPTPKPRPTRAHLYTDSEIVLSKKKTLRKSNSQVGNINFSILYCGGMEIKFNVERCNAEFSGKKKVFYIDELAFEQSDERLVFDYLEIKFLAKSGFKIKSSSKGIDISNENTGYSVKVERKQLPTFV